MKKLSSGESIGMNYMENIVEVREHNEENTRCGVGADDGDLGLGAAGFQDGY